MRAMNSKEQRRGEAAMRSARGAAENSHSKEIRGYSASEQKVEIREKLLPSGACDQSFPLLLAVPWAAAPYVSWRIVRVLEDCPCPGTIVPVLGEFSLSWEDCPCPGRIVRILEDSPCPGSFSMSWEDSSSPGGLSMSWRASPCPGELLPVLGSFSLSWRASLCPGRIIHILEGLSMSWKSSPYPGDLLHALGGFSLPHLLGKLSPFHSSSPLIFPPFLSLCSLSLLDCRFRAPARTSSSPSAQMFAAAFPVPSESRGMPWKSPDGTSVPVLVPQPSGHLHPLQQRCSRINGWINKSSGPQTQALIPAKSSNIHLQAEK